MGEFVANAVSHAAPGRRARSNPASRSACGCSAGPARSCARCSTRPTPPRCSGRRIADEEAGRGLQMVDALSDVWGWSPVTGRGKAVWAILFCAL